MLTVSLLLLFCCCGNLSLFKHGTELFLHLACKASKAGKTNSVADVWKATKMALWKQKTRNAGTGTTAAIKKAAAFVIAAVTIVGPDLCSTSGGVKSLD